MPPFFGSLHTFSAIILTHSVKNLKEIGRIFLLYLFCDVITTDFSRKVLSVWKFGKNQVLEQITNKKHQNADNNGHYKTDVLNFHSFEFF